MRTQLIAITKADGSLAIMHFVLRQERHGADPGWTRIATPENVEAEILKAGFTDVMRWRLVSPQDLPTSREHRNHWHDDGERIVVIQPVG